MITLSESTLLPSPWRYGAHFSEPGFEGWYVINTDTDVSVKVRVTPEDIEVDDLVDLLDAELVDALFERACDRAREIESYAHENGTISPQDMVILFPGEPEKHTTASVREAWAMADLGFDGDVIAEAIWGY